MSKLPPSDQQLAYLSQFSTTTPFTLLQLFLLRNHNIWEKYQAPFELWLSNPQTGHQSLSSFRTKFHDWITTDPNVEMAEDIYEVIMMVLSNPTVFSSWTRMFSHYASRWTVLQQSVDVSAWDEIVETRNEQTSNQQPTHPADQNPAPASTTSSDQPTTRTRGYNVVKKAFSHLPISVLTEDFLTQIKSNLDLSASTLSTQTSPHQTIQSVRKSPFNTLGLPQLSEQLSTGIVPDLATRISLFKPISPQTPSTSQIAIPLSQNEHKLNQSTTTNSPNANTANTNNTINAPIPIHEHNPYKQVEEVIAGAMQHCQEHFLQSLFNSPTFHHAHQCTINLFIGIYNAIYTNDGEGRNGTTENKKAEIAENICQSNGLNNRDQLKPSDDPNPETTPFLPRRLQPYSNLSFDQSSIVSSLISPLNSTSTHHPTTQTSSHHSQPTKNAKNAKNTPKNNSKTIPSSKSNPTPPPPTNSTQNTLNSYNPLSFIDITAIDMVFETLAYPEEYSVDHANDYLQTTLLWAFDLTCLWIQQGRLISLLFQNPPLISTTTPLSSTNDVSNDNAGKLGQNKANTASKTQEMEQADNTLSNIVSVCTNQVLALLSPSQAHVPPDPNKNELIGALTGTFVFAMKTLAIYPSKIQSSLSVWSQSTSLPSQQSTQKGIGGKSKGKTPQTAKQPQSQQKQPQQSPNLQPTQLDLQFLRQLSCLVAYIHVNLKRAISILFNASSALKPTLSNTNTSLQPDTKFVLKKQSTFETINSTLQFSVYLTLFNPHPLIKYAISLCHTLSQHILSTKALFLPPFNTTNSQINRSNQPTASDKSDFFSPRSDPLLQFRHTPLELQITQFFAIGTARSQNSTQSLTSSIQQPLSNLANNSTSASQSFSSAIDASPPKQQQQQQQQQNRQLQPPKLPPIASTPQQLAQVKTILGPLSQFHSQVHDLFHILQRNQLNPPLFRLPPSPPTSQQPPTNILSQSGPSDRSKTTKDSNKSPTSMQSASNQASIGGNSKNSEPELQPTPQQPHSLPTSQDNLEITTPFHSQPAEHTENEQVEPVEHVNDNIQPEEERIALPMTVVLKKRIVPPPRDDIFAISRPRD